MHCIKEISETFSQNMIVLHTKSEKEVSCQRLGLINETLKGALSRYFSVILQCRNMFLHQWKSKNNDSVWLPRTLSLRRNHLLPPITQHGKDGNGLKFEKTSQFFQILEPFLENIARNSLRFAL